MSPGSASAMRKSTFLLALLPAAANAVLLQVGSSTLNNWAEYGVNISAGVYRDWQVDDLIYD